MIRAYLSWGLGRIGYMIRPYDMLADQRRWWFQPRTPCQWSQTELDTVKQSARVRAAEFQRWCD